MHRPSDRIFDDDPILLHHPDEDGPVDYGGVTPWQAAYTAIDQKVAELNGRYGDRLSDVLLLDEGRIYVQALTGGAYIWWSSPTGAHVILGLIYEKWHSLGRENSFLGLPITDELDAPGGGRFSEFSNGSIYWHPTIGAFEVHGAIRSLWLALGGTAAIGYPTTDETDMPNGRFSSFKVPAPQVIPIEGMHSTIFWWPDIGAHILRGEVLVTWRGLGAENSFLRRPLSEHVGMNSIRFERGTLSPQEDDRPMIVADTRIIDTGQINLDGVAANGRARLMINSAGLYNYSGNVHATGALSYDFSIATALNFADAQGRTRAFTAKGDVEGSLTLGGSRNHSWDYWANDSWISSNWDALLVCSVETRLSVEFNESNLAGHIGTLLGIPLVIIGTIVGGAAGGAYLEHNYDVCGGVDDDGNKRATFVGKGSPCPVGQHKQAPSP